MSDTAPYLANVRSHCYILCKDDGNFRQMWRSVTACKVRMWYAYLVWVYAKLKHSSLRISKRMLEVNDLDTWPRYFVCWLFLSPSTTWILKVYVVGHPLPWDEMLLSRWNGQSKKLREWKCHMCTGYNVGNKMSYNTDFLWLIKKTNELFLR